MDFLKHPASGPTTPSPDTGIPRSAATHHLDRGSLPAGTLREPISSPLKPSGEGNQRNPHGLADFLKVEQVQSPPGSSSKPGKEVSCSKFEHQTTLYSCSANAAHGLRRLNADKRRAVVGGRHRGRTRKTAPFQGVVQPVQPRLPPAGGCVSSHLCVATTLFDTTQQ